MGGALAKQTIKGGLLSVVANLGDRILQILKLIVLARLLGPEAFGLLGIALIDRWISKEFISAGHRKSVNSARARQRQYLSGYCLVPQDSSRNHLGWYRDCNSSSLSKSALSDPGSDPDHSCSGDYGRD